MKKKILAAISALALILSMTALTSCELFLPPVEEHEHAFGEWEFTVIPTCKHGGSRSRYCECGEKETEVVAAEHFYDSSNVCRTCGFKAGDYFKFEWVYGGGYAVSANNITDNEVEEIPAEITIPSVYNGAPVTEIATEGFKDCKNLVKVKIPSSITVIRDNAFSGCTSLTSIKANSITTIGNSAFYRCSSLTTVDLGDNITSIGEFAFFGCSSLPSAIIPEGVTVLARNVFSNCLSITEVTIPDHIIEIGSGAFSGCENLATVNLPDSLRHLGKNAFLKTACYESLTSDNGVIYFGSYLLEADESVAGNYTVKEGTTVIAAEAFKGLPLTDLTLPDSLISVGASAFADCDKLMNIDFGNGVKYITTSAFRNTPVKTINIPDSIEYIGSGAFYIDTSGPSREQDVSLPDKAIELYCDSFYWELDDYDETGAIYIGKHLMRAHGVDTEQPFVVKEGTITIAAKAFNYGINIRSYCVNVVLPDSLQYIGDYAFSDCKLLESINIPKNVTYIGKYAFNGCKSLTSLTFDDPEGWTVSEYKNGRDSIAIPAESLSDSAEAIKCIRITYSAYYWMKK